MLLAADLTRRNESAITIGFNIEFFNTIRQKQS
jgi:hypothetical protein